jgi:hypothetical protein
MTADEPPNGHSQLTGECRFLGRLLPSVFGTMVVSDALDKTGDR